MAAQSYRIHYCRPDSPNSIMRTLGIDTVHFREDISLKIDFKLVTNAQDVLTVAHQYSNDFAFRPSRARNVLAHDTIELHTIANSQCQIQAAATTQQTHLRPLFDSPSNCVAVRFVKIVEQVPAIDLGYR